MQLEQYFKKYRDNIIGINHSIKTPYHENIPLVYTDWTASGRCYAPIENRISKELMPCVANTHTDTNHTGSTMTYAYHRARQIIKKHVGALDTDVLISNSSGMTGVVNKFQRILGLKVHECFENQLTIEPDKRPIVFVTHMEHHSNQTSWIETIADVVVVPPNEDGLVCLKKFEEAFEKYADRETKIAAITSCSNVTGLITPYNEIAQIAHNNGGLCFVDFACSGPYVDIDMHNNDENGRYLDAIYFSPHKFLGGPGTTGILLFDQQLYKNRIPDNPGGGTVDWTNPWGRHKFVDDIESREDGGTPAFLQTIKTAMCMQLKDDMGVKNIHAREVEIVDELWATFSKIPNLHLLAGEHKNRLGILSFYIDNLHFNLGVKMLNDRFGIQTRGGCSCAGTYGHFLLGVSQEQSMEITSKIDEGSCAEKPGWIRLSIHPTTSSQEIEYLCKAVKELAQNHQEWKEDYDLNFDKGVISHKNKQSEEQLKFKVDECFDLAF